MEKNYQRWVIISVVLTLSLLIILSLSYLLLIQKHANTQRTPPQNVVFTLNSRTLTMEPAMQISTVSTPKPTATPKPTQIVTPPIVQPTIQPIVQPTATPQPTSPPALTPAQIYSQAMTGSGLYGFANTTATDTQSGAIVFALANVSVSDFTLQSDITMSGDGGGLVFRLNGSEYNRFRMGLDGNYDLASPTGTLISGKTTAITQGSNQLTIIAHGSNVYIYINQQFIGKVTDSDTVAGEVGCMAVDYSQSSTVTCSNFRFLSIPAGARF